MRDVHVAGLRYISGCVGWLAEEADLAVWPLHALVATGDIIADFYFSWVYLVVLVGPFLDHAPVGRPAEDVFAGLGADVVVGVSGYLSLEGDYEHVSSCSKSNME